MARTTDEPRDNMAQTMLSDAELARLDDWAWSKRIRTRSEAMRQLLDLGLAADAAGWTTDGPPKPKRSKK